MLSDVEKAAILC